MKKGISAFIALILLQPFCTAQNLVPNGSFEVIDECPNDLNDLSSLGWQHWLQSPNCFNECSLSLNETDSLMDVPLNGFGWQEAATGNGYIGLCTYGNPDLTTVYREVAGVQLSEPLEVDTSYYISFKTSLATEGFYYQMDIASDKIGVLFTTEGFDWIENPIPLVNTAHLYTAEIIEDTMNWVLVSGILLATEAYTHLGVGNFFDNANTNIIPYGPGLCAYYYVDDLVVMKLSDYISVAELGLQPVIATTEPGNQYRCITTFPKGEAKLFDLNGNQIWETHFNQQVNIDLTNHCSGVYILCVSDERKQHFNYKLLKL